MNLKKETSYVVFFTQGYLFNGYESSYKDESPAYESNSLLRVRVGRVIKSIWISFRVN